MTGAALLAAQWITFTGAVGTTYMDHAIRRERPEERRHLRMHGKSPEELGTAGRNARKPSRRQRKTNKNTNGRK